MTYRLLTRKIGKKEEKMARGLFVLCILLMVIFLFPLASREHVNAHVVELKDSYKIREAQVDKKVGRRCSYVVKINTSCISAQHMGDSVSIFLGDADDNRVHVPRLDNPSSGTFERCSMDKFKIRGPCTKRICFLYLSRSGWDGWIPDSVTVYKIDDSRPFAFYCGMGSLLPNAKWHGCDLCVREITLNSNDATELANRGFIWQL